MVKRVARWALRLIALTLVIALLLVRPDRAMRVAAGVTAHNLCAAHFVAGLDADATFNEMVKAMVGATPSRFLRYTVDDDGRLVSASFAGIVHATARFIPGYGCRLDFPENLPAPPASPLQSGSENNGGPEPIPVAQLADDKASLIAAAVDRVFAEQPGKPIKNVKAVVVMQDDRIIAERYAPGIDAMTPLPSFSVAKSISNALLGILVKAGRLKVDQKVSAPEWVAHPDGRSQITINDLMRMQSGLAAEETGSGLDPESQMEFARADMAGYVATLPLKESPGTHWDYTSADTLLLDRLLGQTVGGGAPGMRDFAHRELFGPLHMTGVTMQFDGAGTFIGSSQVYAPARSYVRFGQLFLHDGVLANGERILPEGWIDWSRQATLGSSYGAGWWTNDGPSDFAAWRVARGFPKDGYFASGNLGQRIYVVPSAHLIVARFGYSQGSDFGIRDDLALIDAVIKAGRADAR